MMDQMQKQSPSEDQESWALRRPAPTHPIWTCLAFANLLSFFFPYPLFSKINILDGKLINQSTGMRRVKRPFLLSKGSQLVTQSHSWYQSQSPIESGPCLCQSPMRGSSGSGGTLPSVGLDMVAKTVGCEDGWHFSQLTSWPNLEKWLRSQLMVVKTANGRESAFYRTGPLILYSTAIHAWKFTRQGKRQN